MESYITNAQGSCSTYNSYNIIVSLYSLAHVEGEVDVLLLGEEQDEEVITCLTLLDGRVQTDLLK